MHLAGPALLVFAGGMVGAVLRYLTDRVLQARHDSVFPWGTLGANILGCLIFGMLVGAGLRHDDPLFVLLGAGFCGALTTYSTFSYETFRLVEQHSYFYAVMNVILSLIAGLGAALLGFTAISARG